MNRWFQITSLLLMSILCLSGYAQTRPSTKSSPPPPPPSPQPLKAPLTFGLEDGTPIRLRINSTISSADAKVGDTVDFEVLEDVKFGETVIIQRGAIALATVTEAVPKRRLARGGKLNVNIDTVRLVSGEKAALRAVKEVSGDGHTGA